MTEEIREGIAEIILMSWGKDEKTIDTAYDITKYLHSRGVVIKRDELPTITKKGWYYLVKPLMEK